MTDASVLADAGTELATLLAIAAVCWFAWAVVTLTRKPKP